jgi:membrane protease YdiL (CAAX protease family)
VTIGDLLRVLFAVAFVVMAAATLGALLTGPSPDRDYRAGALLLVMVGVGAGLWVLAEWMGGRNGRP